MPGTDSACSFSTAGTTSVQKPSPSRTAAIGRSVGMWWKPVSQATRAG